MSSVAFLCVVLSGATASEEIVVEIEGMGAGTLPVDAYRNWHFYVGNPILVAEGDLEMQAGEGNIYAPDVLRFDDGYGMWYGGQGRDGHDRIFFALSEDGIHWRRHPVRPSLDVNGWNHVNDPTVVRAEGTYYLYHSVAPVREEDEIHLATSTDGVTWTPRGSVIPFGPPGAWDSFKVGRPSVLYEDGLFKMWYDGTNSDPTDRKRIGDPARRHVGLATSRDGFHWTKYEGNPIVLDAGAVDVERVGDAYVLLAESGTGTRWYTSPDGVSWTFQGMLFGLSGEVYDRAGQVTPMAYVEDGAWVAVYFGGAKEPNWNRNRIAVAFAQKRVVVEDADGSPVAATIRALDRDRVRLAIPSPPPERVRLRVLSPDGETEIASIDVTGTASSPMRLGLTGNRLVPVP